MSFDWNIYKGNLGWLPQRTLFITRHGSHAYGTNLPTSDLDLRGVCIAPKVNYLGFQPHNRFEQAEQHEPDFTIFDIRKFFLLACDCNPNVLELLYTDPSDHLVLSPEWERIREKRDSFLSRKAKHTFSGYATAQLKRINIHYKWLKDPPKAQPLRSEFGLPERTVIPADQLAAATSAITKVLDSWQWRDMEEFDEPARIRMRELFTERLLEVTKWSWDDVEVNSWIAAARSIGYDTNFIELLDKERRYTAAHRTWSQYQEWKKNRNPARAALEEKFGYDTKHAMHLVRLLRMCREILSGKGVLVRRPDAAELLEIRAGMWTYDELVSWAVAQDAELSELMRTSILPQQPDRAGLEKVCVQLIEESMSPSWAAAPRPVPTVWEQL